MGVPLPRGLRCQGSAWYDELGHCPKSQGWRTEVDDRGLTLREKTRREEERSRGGEFALSPL